VNLWIAALILMLSHTSDAHADSFLNDTQSIAVVQIPGYEIEQYGIDPTIGNLALLEKVLEFSEPEAVMEPDVVLNANSPDDVLNARKETAYVNARKLQSELSVLSDPIDHLRALIFRSPTHALSPYQVVNIVGYLSLTTEESPESLALIVDISNHSEELALNLAEPFRLEKLGERVDAQLRKGLKDGLYSVDTLRAVKNPNTSDQATTEVYNDIGSELIQQDIQWYKRLVTGINLDISLGVFRAAKRTQSPELYDLVRLAAQLPADNPKRAHAQAYVTTQASD